MNDGFKSAVFATSIRPVQRQGSVGAFEYSPMQGQVRAVGYTQTQQPIRVVTTDTLQIIVPTYEQITRPVTTERPAPIVPVAPTAPTGTKRAPFVPLLPPLGGMGELGGMDSSYLTATRFVNNYVPSIPELVRYF
jgi:hypothetical protein